MEWAKPKELLNLTRRQAHADLTGEYTLLPADAPGWPTAGLLLSWQRWERDNDLIHLFLAHSGGDVVTPPGGDGRGMPLPSAPPGQCHAEDPSRSRASRALFAPRPIPHFIGSASWPCGPCAKPPRSATTVIGEPPQPCRPPRFLYRRKTTPRTV